MRKVLIKERQEARRKNQLTIKCAYPECEKSFKQVHSRHKFCSDTCKGSNKYFGKRLVDHPPRICRNIDCGKEFLPSNSNQLCCSKDCAQIHQFDPERQAKKYPQGYFRPKKCKDENCENIFTPRGPSHLYCSDSCKENNGYYMRTYGITRNDYEKMEKAQGYKCAICNSEGFLIGENNHSAKLAVDHCHKSGKVRKLLCHNCNRALGLLQENISNFEAAISYLKEHSTE